MAVFTFGTIMAFPLLLEESESELQEAVCLLMSYVKYYSQMCQDVAPHDPVLASFSAVVFDVRFLNIGLVQ